MRLKLPVGFHRRVFLPFGSIFEKGETIHLKRVIEEREKNEQKRREFNPFPLRNSCAFLIMEGENEDKGE